MSAAGPRTQAESSKGKGRLVSYRFERGETVSAGVKRIALEQINDALQQTKAQGRDLDGAIHDTRVAFKKLRGLLRLVRSDLGDEIYQEENTFYRDANRRLSSARDSAALAEIIDHLNERFRDQLGEGAFQSWRGILSQSTRKRQAEKEQALTEVHRTLDAAGYRVEQWPMGSGDFSSPGRGLKKIYTLGRNGFATACEEQTIDAFHEWRKQVKYLWYHVRLLRLLWPGPLKQLAEELKMLARYLSDDHDLAMLHERVLEQSTGKSDQTEDNSLVVLINQRRAELQVLAQLLGKRVYAETPKTFKSRFNEYWQAWQTEENQSSPPRWH